MRLTRGQQTFVNDFELPILPARHVRFEGELWKESLGQQGCLSSSFLCGQVPLSKPIDGT